jgi:hypothetical protein
MESTKNTEKRTKMHKCREHKKRACPGCVLMGKQNDLLDYQNANIYPDVVNINGINKLSLLTA